MNLFSQCNYCDSPQPRYKLHPNHSEAYPGDKYLKFKQCLPGCVTNSREFNKTIELQNGNSSLVNVTNDISCLPFDPSPANNVIKPTNFKGKILNFYIRWKNSLVNLLMIILIIAWSALILQVRSKPQLYFFLDPQKEVVSIYNNDFTTPESKVPYFIEVYRCVVADHTCSSDKKPYPVPSKKTEIEIVVPDLTNRYRDPLKKKFYKYVVYNHTSCKCGTSKERENSIEIKNETGKILETHMSSFMASSYHGDLVIKQESSVSKPLTWS